MSLEPTNQFPNNQLDFFIGNSGWTHDYWKDRFHPENLPNKSWLDYYAS
jgi:uncharacterized protein YecE (DUF72 family)